MKSIPNPENLRIPILSGSYFNLQKFDFSFCDVEILNIQSKKFKNYVLKYQTCKWDNEPLNFIEHLQKKLITKHDKFYAIIKKNPLKDYNYRDLVNVWKILLVIFPSDLQIEHVIEFYDYSGPSISTWDKRMSGSYPGKPLYTKGDVSDINKFINIVFNKLNKDSYINFTIQNYITSFETSHFTFQYLNLCICLESTIKGNFELNYRLRRGIAIICGENYLTSEIIFNNLKLIYELRSKIVHGEKYDLKKVLEYNYFLKAIVSRTIIELLIHDIENVQQLDEIITKIGFGERSKISKDWKDYTLNILTFSDANYTELKK